ncbi:hypothetical protein PybrP1_012793, partial [[Pythium] brassicae (nom. inval.)]
GNRSATACDDVECVLAGPRVFLGSLFVALFIRSRNAASLVPCPSWRLVTSRCFGRLVTSEPVILSRHGLQRIGSGAAGASVSATERLCGSHPCAVCRSGAGDIKAARRLLQDYKDKDLDFGLDARGLGELLAGEKDWAGEVVDAFGGTNGMYDWRRWRLKLLCWRLEGLALVASRVVEHRGALTGDAGQRERTRIHLWRLHGVSWRGSRESRTYGRLDACGGVRMRRSSTGAD